MGLNLEKENDFMIYLSKQASTISDILLKRQIQPLVSETIQLYLPKLNKIERKNLTLYLKWSSQKNKLKLSELSFRK